MAVRSALLSELPGWAEWLARHRAELGAEELEALLAWRVLLDESGAGPVEFGWFLAEARRSLGQVDALGEPEEYPQPFVRGPRHE